MARFFRAAILMVCFLYAGSAFAAAGACPAGSPLAGNNNCYFIAANGSDSNNGTSESTPWLHAPGMPNCSGTCATVQSSWGSYGNTPMNLGGVGLIFRGGDTWHFGNSGAGPYTGGTWNIWWSGNTSCAYETGERNCFYIGVDQTWYSGSSWARPILNGDNTPSTSLVSSCSYSTGSANTFLSLASNNNTYLILDSFEFTGLCSNDTANQCSNAGCSVYTSDNGSCSSGCVGVVIKRNLYMHGWTTTTAIPSTNSAPCTLMAGGGIEAWDHLVVDGSDSSKVGNLLTCQIAIFPNILHMRDSIFRYAMQIATVSCHDLHDNILEHFSNQYYSGGHDNALECNGDASGSTPNVFYNNIIRHFDPSWSSAGQVTLWFCPNTTPEYWFNNLEYDIAASQGTQWDVVGPPTYTGCSNTGRQYLFNNTFVNQAAPCNMTANNNTGGQYLYAYNNHLIGSSWAGTGCNGGASSTTNVNMSNSTATGQGYTTGASGTAGTGNTCANDTTTPCAPTAAENSTVGAGTNFQSYCTTLASYTSEYAIGTEAANACKYGTTDGCSYDPTAHTMNCPALTAVARPSSAAWDSGAYMYSATLAPAPKPPTGSQGPKPPTGLQATVQ